MKDALTPAAPVVAASPVARHAVSPLIAAACVAVFAAAFVAVHVLRPDLDPSWHPISLYALGPHGWVMTVCFAAWGLGPIAIAANVHRRVRTRVAKVGLLLLVVGAAGPLLAAVFAMDPLNTPPERMSTGGWVHAGSAVLGDLLPIGAFVLSLSLTREGGVWANMRRRVRSAGALALGMLLISSVAIAAMMPPSGELGPDVAAGWVTRLFVIASNAWVAVAAWASLRGEPPAPATT